MKTSVQVKEFTGEWSVHAPVGRAWLTVSKYLSTVPPTRVPRLVKYPGGVSLNLVATRLRGVLVEVYGFSIDYVSKD